MGLFVDTTGTDVPIRELGITIFDPTSNFDIGGQFSPAAVELADSLTAAIQAGTLAWKKTSGGSIETPSDYDNNWLHTDDLNLGPGFTQDRLVAFKDLLNNGPNGGGPLMFSKSGNANAGDSLDAGTVPTDRVGQPMKGSNSVVSLSMTNEVLVTTSQAEVIMTRRTGVSTWVDVAGTNCPIPVGEYRAIGIFDVQLPDDPELGCRLTDSSSQLKNPLVTVQLRYDGPSA